MVGLNLQSGSDIFCMNTSINKTGFQPVSRTCGTTPFGFKIAEEKSDRHYVLKDNGAFSTAKPIFKPVTKHLEAENEPAQWLAAGVAPNNEVQNLCYKTCVPQVKMNCRSVHFIYLICPRNLR